MIVAARGIVLNTIRYSDSSVIARIYTDHSGLLAFMVRTGKGRAALPKLGLLQPLTLVDLSFKEDERKQLKSLCNIERSASLNAIPFDTVKTCLAIFMAEVISRSIGEEEKNAEMFDFLQSSILQLDRSPTSVNNFHLKFMLEFSRYLGFYPHGEMNGSAYFDLIEGEFCSSLPIHAHVLEGNLVAALSSLLGCDMERIHELRIGNSARREILQKLIDYYRLHLHGMKEIGAHKVLEEVLS